MGEVFAKKTNSVCPSELNIEEFFLDLKGARTIPPAKIDPDRKPPAWLDFNLARRGQQFARNNLPSISISHMFGLASSPYTDGIDILLLSGNFSTPASATKRYTSTITEIITWYTDPFWESGSDGNITDIYKSLNRVRALHSALACAASKKISRGEILSDASEFSDYAPTAAWAAAKKDLNNSNIPPSQRGIAPSNEKIFNAVPFNQQILALIQFAFIGFPILFPERLGISCPNEDDLSAFNHLWAILGYLVGIEDKYNIALRPNLKSAREVYRGIFERYAIPSLFHAEKDAIFVADVTFQGLQGITSISPNILMYWTLKDILQIQATNTYKALTFTEKIISAAKDHVMFDVLKNPISRKLSTFFLLNTLLVVGKENFGPQYAKRFDSIKKSFGFSKGYEYFGRVVFGLVWLYKIILAAFIFVYKAF
ncbi:hypothetical protein Fcan01_22186 [Folsomia candida]|uniref:ER-bound oxygenase mpaB/mpaB'/Rubber oxygenase catalytic domain-containing protein n=1 Tax=Folsomia candida TaxID=158441 RepID=A0A226DD47_FOLCA|nr:hypothetical protein Fcan01_22186 [Folsomia candida]